MGSGCKEGLYELPLQQWTDVGESRVKPRDFLRAVGEMAAIYRTYQLRSNLNRLLAILSAPFVRYVGAGGIGTLLHYATLALVVEFAGVNPAAGTVIGAMVGAIVNYFLNYHLTFASNAAYRHTVPRFFAIAVLSATLNGAGMWFAVHLLKVHYIFAQAACTVAVLVIGFMLNRIWTFKSSFSNTATRKTQPGEHISSDCKAAIIRGASSPEGSRTVNL